MRGTWAVVLGISFACLGCEKPPTSEPTAVAAPADPIDKATVVLLDKLRAGDYEGLRAETVSPLTDDLSEAEFNDLAAVVQWLGPVQEQSVARSDDSHGGGQRWYTLKCEQGGAVDLEVSIDADGKLIGFVFDGKGYEEAERGVLAEPWLEFRVYDFALVDGEGKRLPADAPVAGTRVDYEIVVGGLEAMLGGHHLTVQKIVLDGAGKEVFHEPIEFDTKFEEDAMGIPRGTVRGYVEVPGPGTWTMDLVIMDNNAHREIEHKTAFATQ